MASTLDSILENLQTLLQNSRRQDGELNRLKAETQIITVLFQCEKCWRNQANQESSTLNRKNQAALRSSISKVKSAVNGSAKFLLPRLNCGPGDSEFAEAISRFRESLRSSWQQVADLYTSMSGSLSQSNTPWPCGDFMSIFDALLESLGDIITWAEACGSKIEELVEPLQEALRFLKNFTGFVTLGETLPQGFEGFLLNCQVTVVNAAHLCCMCLFCGDDGQVFNELKLKCSELVQKIKPVTDEVNQEYTKILMSSRSSSRSSSTLLIKESDMHIMGDFVDSLVDYLWDLLSGATNFVVSVKHQMQILAEGLKFLKTILKRQQNMFPDLRHDMKNVVIDVVYKATGVIFQLYMLRKQESLASEMDLQIFPLLEGIEVIRREVATKFQVESTFNFPTINELKFFDLILDKLKELASCKVDSVSFADIRIQNVQKDLEFLRSFLEKIQQRHEREELRALWSSSIEVAYKVEYAIDSLVVSDMSHYSLMLFNATAEEIMLLRIEALNIDDTRLDMSPKAAAMPLSLDPSKSSLSQVVDIVVGFDVETKELINLLTRGSEFDIISIVGMPGLGKTTIAKKVFRDFSVMQHFQTRAMCSVSQVYNRKDIIVEILHCLALDAHRGMDQYDLETKLRRCLKGKRYLIFLDDVWDIKAWDDFKMCFPNDSKGSRILLTSRNRLPIEPTVRPYPLRRLTADECLELLKIKLGHKRGFPPDLRGITVQIARNCEGLPLTVVVVAGILANLAPSSWEDVGGNLRSNAVCGTEDGMSILELSYRHLPDYLKPCLLYFAAFREDQEINIKRLAWLWIAEGYVQKNEQTNLEDIAEDYVVALISRSLVLVGKQGTQGRIRTCRIHDLLHEFCLMKSKKANFVELIHGRDKLLNFDEGNNLRRLSIYSQPKHFAKSRLHYLKVRSLLFSSQDSAYETAYNLSFVACLKLLRVLDLGQINLGSLFPGEIAMLVQLRFLAILGKMENIPPSIANLSNLETFLVTINSYAVEALAFPNTLWNMKELRHLHVHGCFVDLPVDNDNLEGTSSTHSENPSSSDGESSSTLDNLCSFFTLKLHLGQSMETVMRKVPNIRKLKCHLSESVDSIGDDNEIVVINFPSELESLELNLGDVEMHHIKFNFPPSLKKLTLIDFSWSMLSSISELLNLEVLKLLNGGVDGSSTWEMEEEEEFGMLEFLKIEFSDIVSWTGSGDHFPCLQKLVLEGCEELNELPSCFSTISTLDLIELRNCGDNVATSVREIEEQQKYYGNDGLQVLIS